MQFLGCFQSLLIEGFIVIRERLGLDKSGGYGVGASAHPTLVTNAVTRVGHPNSGTMGENCRAAVFLSLNGIQLREEFA